MSFISDRISKVKPSATLLITAIAKKMRAEGKDVIGLGAGEPDFDTPENIKKAAIEAITSGFTKYTAVGGTDDLKSAIAYRLAKDSNVDYDPSEILVSCGAKHSIYNILQAVLNKGDEVIIPAPYWVSYPDMALLADGIPVIVSCSEEASFKMSPSDFMAAITPETKVVIINSPSNPTGSAYTKNELRELSQIAIDNNLLIVSDEIYNKIVYDNFEVVSIASFGGDIKKNTMIVNGVSKSYSMTGWRIGYTAGDASIIKAMGKIQAQSTSNPCSISQVAAVEALRGPQNIVGKMVAEFEKRKKFMVNRLRGINGVNCFEPVGAFYAFPDISHYFGRSYKGKEIKGSADLSNYLLEEAAVAVVPGEAFGADNHVRISYATDINTIKKGLDRIEKALTAP